ncbi:MAG: ABC transporter ATP-binding protein [Eubacteriales bacterium]|nr:ABC transporter ATP-binding protein [Eubacteriales bacterium]
MRKVSAYIRKYWYMYAIALVCMVIQVSLDMLSPQVTASLIDDVLGKRQVDLLPKLLLLIFIIGAGRAIFGYLKEFLFDFTSSKIGNGIRQTLFTHIQSLSVDYFDRTNTGELMSRVKDDVDKVWNATGYVGMLVMEVTIHTTIILFCMYRLNKRLFIIPVVVMPLVACMAILLENRLGKVYDEISEENAALNTVAQENLAGVHTVKAFAREPFEIKKFLSHNQRYYELNMRQSKVLVRYQPLFQLISRLLPILAVIYGGFLVIDGEITLGTLGAFSEYCTNIVWPMEMLGWLLNDLASGVASNRKIQRIYAQKPTITEPENPQPIRQPEKAVIEFDHVTWKVEDKTILSNVSFTLEPGKTLGIMGATGSGKTSIVQLLMRLFDVTEGEIRIGGTDIRKLSLEELRRFTAPVLQDVFLFSDTVRANVSMGCKEQPSDEEIWAALDEACATEFVREFRSGLDTLIGERGIGLSGGQKQRISMARAFVRKAHLLVLDDSTSALDMETEREIQGILARQKEQTRMIIAHRISAVCAADEILVLEDGRIRERGTHRELMEKKGYYYETYLSQYGEEEGRERLCQ